MPVARQFDVEPLRKAIEGVHEKEDAHQIAICAMPRRYLSPHVSSAVSVRERMRYRAPVQRSSSPATLFFLPRRRHDVYRVRNAAAARGHNELSAATTTLMYATAQTTQLTGTGTSDAPRTASPSIVG